MKLRMRNPTRKGLHPGKIRNDEGERIRQFIEDTVQPKELDTFTVGLAGSATLSWYLEALHEEFQASAWTPFPFDWNDINIFVCGPHAETRIAFVAFVNGMKVRMARKGYVTEESMEPRFHTIGVGNLCTQVMRLHVRSIASPISIVRCHGALNVMEVVEHFDLDVCRIIYNFRHNSYQLSSMMKENIQRGEMEIHARLMELATESHLPLSQMLMMERSVDRIDKYKARGFAITNSPNAVSEFKRCVEKSRMILDCQPNSEDNSEDDDDSEVDTSEDEPSGDEHPFVCR